ncbi:MAG: TolC family protein [Nitrospirota bacterium]
MKLTAGALLTVLLAVFVNSAGAEKLALPQAIQAALEGNPALKSYVWTLQAQKEDLKSAKGGLFPKFKIEERYQRTDNPTYGFMSKLNQERFTQEDFLIGSLNDPADISDFQTSFSIEQPLLVPGVYAGINMAGKELEARQSEYQRKKEEVVLNVVKTFNAVLTSGKYVEAALKGREDAEEHKRIALLRYDAGMGLHSDVLRAGAAVNRAEAALIRAESNMEVARRALGLLMGLKDPVDAADDGPMLPLLDLDVYLASLVQREDLNALKSRYDNSRQSVKMERSSLLPQAGVSGSYFFNDHNSPFSPEGESYLVAGFIRWNIVDISAHHRIRKAQARVREMGEAVAGFEKEIHFRINEAYIRAREKEQNLSLSKSVLEEAEEALRLVGIRYENSLAPMVDLLDTQTAADMARARLLEAENEYMNAIADLYYQSGILLKTVNQNYGSGITNYDDVK